MKISLNIVTDCLSGFKYTSYVSPETSPEFDRAALLPTDGSELYEDRLYVCRLSQAIMLKSMNDLLGKRICFLCLRDRLVDTLETEDTMSGMVVINENISFESLFDKVQNCFCRISEWYLRVQSAVISGKSLQDIMDESESILGNYVQITDSDFKLIAFTKNIECSEPITVLAREHGYHPESTVKIFQKYNRINAWNSGSGILINDSREFSDYVLLSRIFRFSNTYFAHAVMTCNHREATPGLIDIFRMFADMIAIFVEKDWDAATNCVHIYDSFIKDILDRSLSQYESTKERAKHVSIPVEGNFCLCVTSPDEEGKYSLGRIAQEIQCVMPNDKLIIYREQIVILAILPKKTFIDRVREIQEKLLPVMEKYDVRCGISAVFHSILDAPDALKQSQMALRVSGCTPGASLLPKVSGAVNGLQQHVTTFEDSFYYILLGNNRENESLWKNSVYYKALKILHDYDTQHEMNNLQLLYVYLLSESRHTETGKIMHMSRNNVVYRIGKIQDMLNIDLSNPSSRFKLLVSYSMMQLYGLA